MENQRIGDNQWKCQLEKSEDHVNYKVWKGNKSHLLADQVSKHRHSCVPMVKCSSHISFQLPNEISRARKLISGIE